MLARWPNAATSLLAQGQPSAVLQIAASTNSIESLNARYRRAVKARGHFPTEQVAMKRL